MAGFELIVRPVVFPNIRPAPAQVLPAEDDPTQGMAVIGGSPRRKLSASYSWSINMSRQKPHKENKRQYNKERVYQQDDQGNINKNNFIDVERLRKVRLETTTGPYKMIFADPPPRTNVDIIEPDLVRGTEI
jgi:hypothetical protein